ncbi:VIT family protein [Citricoccus sp. SGAir0253]|uniref:VIT1/CCC1 transporter family protein n=1 Tax=Citricoccus sp. SGAir0253 TaxID=2567881 RepID=UPI0010CD0DF1|nr:VIT1/CCC1 transporter family protein [Citricoccus sp. SGAir0253]QCU77231.1 VIT family protein [Citricoccus sp. SGAir0253]
MSDAPATPDRAGTGAPGHPGRHEPHGGGESLAQRLNWLRAGVLGANDGIVSVAATVVGVAAATTADAPVLIAGVAAVVGGAISMAVGEYVSVSSSSDSQTALIHKERRELAEDPAGELEELVEIYRQQGLSEPTARRVAEEFTAQDPIRAHLRAELNLSEDEVLSPWRAAGASFLAFLVGALLPFLTIVLAPVDTRIPLTFAVTVLALALTGAAGAWLGGARPLPATLRVVAGGAVALAVTFAIGALLGTTGVV